MDKEHSMLEAGFFKDKGKRRPRSQRSWASAKGPFGII
jgi:hypothetical protein